MDIQNIIEERKVQAVSTFKEIHADMLKGRVSPLYVNKQLEKEIEQTAQAVLKVVVEEVQKIADTTPPNLLLNEIVNHFCVKTVLTNKEYD